MFRPDHVVIRLIETYKNGSLYRCNSLSITVYLLFFANSVMVLN